METRQPLLDLLKGHAPPPPLEKQMRPGQAADTVRVVQPVVVAPQARSRLQTYQLLREHGMAGVITAFYVFVLVFLQIGLTKWSQKKIVLSC